MYGKKRSFFERLTGTVSIDGEDFSDYETPEPTPSWPDEPRKDEWLDRVENTGEELAIDMYQTPDEIVLQAMVPGVRPEDIDISITREMVTIRGHREGPRGVEDHDYYHQELMWGNFSRTVVLPVEIEVEESEALESHGLLILHLPKVNKAKETRLSVKSRA